MTYALNILFPSVRVKVFILVVEEKLSKKIIIKTVCIIALLKAFFKNIAYEFT